MSRKNRTVNHTPFSHHSGDRQKRRFATKLQAESAAQNQMLLSVNLELYVYKGLDGGWYLTRKKPD